MTAKKYTMSEKAIAARRKGAMATHSKKREKAKRLKGYSYVFIPVAVIEEIDQRRGKLTRWKFIAKSIGVTIEV